MKHQPSLAIVISDLGGGGAQKVLVQMMREWLNRGHTITLITLSNVNSDVFIIPKDVDRIALNICGNSKNIIDGLRKNYNRILKIRSTLDSLNAEIVISFVGVTNILTVLATRFLDMNVIISERNDPSRQSYGTLWDTLRCLVYPRATMVTANSFNAIKTLSQFVEQKKLAYVPNPITQFEQKIKIERSKKQFLAVGRLYEQKAYDVLIKAVSISRMRELGWELIILGDGPLREELEMQSQSLNVSDLIKWKGHVTEPYLYYSSATAFIMPSRYEGTPNALMEAMSFALPCLISDVIEVGQNIIVENESVLIFNVDNATELAKKMELIMCNPERVEKIGKMGQKVILENMSMNKAIDAWQEIFNNLDINRK